MRYVTLSRYACAAVSLIVCLCSLAAARGEAKSPAFMPGCDVVISIDLAKMRAAGIMKQMQELQEMSNQAGPNKEALDKWTEFSQKLREISGLEEDDFLSVTAAANLDGIDFDSGKEPDLAAIDAVLAVQLGKSLDADRLLQILNRFGEQMAEEKDLDAPPEISKVQHGNATLFVGTDPEDPGKQIHFSMVGNGRTFLMGTEKGIKGALGRAGRPGSMNTLFPAAVSGAVSSSGVVVLFSPTPAMTAKMQAEASKGPAGGGPAAGTAAMARQALAGIKAFGIGIDAAEAMDFKWVGEFGDEAAAQQIRTLLDTQVISGVKMFSTMMTGGKPLPLLTTLEAGIEPGNLATLQFTLSARDMTTFREAAEARMQPPAGDAKPVMPPTP